MGEYREFKIYVEMTSEETYQNLQTFDDINQLNGAVRAHKERFQAELSKTALLVLDLLQRYSAKYKGVSFLTKNKIAEMVGKSRRTIIRVCQQLESLGIIRQYEMKRKSDMQQTSNAVVIQPGEEEKAENVTQEKPEMSHQKDNIFLKQINNNNHLNVKRSPYIKFVPKSLQHFQTYFGNKLKDLYSRVWLAAKKLDISPDQETMQMVGFKAMEQLKQYLKDGKPLTADQLCKLAYKISYNQLKDRLDSGEIFDINDFHRMFDYIQKSKAKRGELDVMGVY